MKKTIKVLGNLTRAANAASLVIIALVTIIGFSMIACGGGDDDGGGGGGKHTLTFSDGAPDGCVIYIRLNNASTTYSVLDNNGNYNNSDITPAFCKERTDNNKNSYDLYDSLTWSYWTGSGTYTVLLGNLSEYWYIKNVSFKNGSATIKKAI